MCVCVCVCVCVFVCVDGGGGGGQRLLLCHLFSVIIGEELFPSSRKESAVHTIYIVPDKKGY